MYISKGSEFPLWWRRGCRALLALAFCIGLILGIFSAGIAGETFFSMMRGAAYSTVSIPGLLSMILLPFLFTAFAVYFSHPWLLLLIGFGKAFSFGLCSCGVMWAFGSAGWLIRMLLIFSDGMILPVLMWLWLRHISGRKPSFSRDLAVCAAFALFIGGFDYCVVSPFLVTLL